MCRHGCSIREDNSSTTTVAHNRGKYKHDFRQVHCMRIHGRSVEERGSNAEPSMGNNKKTKKGKRKTQEKKSNHTEANETTTFSECLRYTT